MQLQRKGASAIQQEWERRNRYKTGRRFQSKCLQRGRDDSHEHGQRECFYCLHVRGVPLLKIEGAYF